MKKGPHSTASIFANMMWDRKNPIFNPQKYLPQIELKESFRV